MLIKAEWPTLGIGAQRRNLLINGNMDIWQRGDIFSATAALGFAADRWRVYASGVATQAQRNTADARSEYCLGFTGVTGNTECAFLQRIEHINSRQLNLQDISVSGAFFSQVVGTTVTCLLYKPVGVDDYTTKTLLASKVMGTIVQNTFTDLKVTFPASLFGSGDFTNGVEVVFSYGAVANGIIVAATRVQLEIGPASTPFEFRQISEEIALCQRYYEKSYNQGTVPGTAATAGRRMGAAARANDYYTVDFKAVKRPAVTVSIYSPQDGANGFAYNYTTSANVAISGAVLTGESSFNTAFTVPDTNLLGFQWSASSEI